MNAFVVIVPIGALAIVWAVFREIARVEDDPAHRIHKAQQLALKAHHAMREREQKSAQKAWKARSKIIKPRLHHDNDPS